MNAAGRPPPHPPPHHSLNLNNSDSIIMNRTEQWQITVQLRTQWEGIGSHVNPTAVKIPQSQGGESLRMECISITTEIITVFS